MFIIKNNIIICVDNHKKYQALIKKDNKYDKTRGRIYFIAEEFGEFVKIGLTKSNLQSRLQILQVGNPRKLVLLYSFQDNNVFKKEKEIHKLFKDLKVKGEWFLLDNRILDYIKNLKNV